jgi:hypothetical protein
MEGSFGDVKQKFAQVRRFLKPRAGSDALDNLPPFVFGQIVLAIYWGDMLAHLRSRI